MLFFGVSQKVLCQYNSARLVLVSGGSLSFSFNNLADYKNGKTDANGTILAISMADNALDPTVVDGFELYVNTPDAVIQGEDIANTLALNTIELDATILGGLPTSTINPLLPSALVNGVGPSCCPPVAPTGLLLISCTGGCTDVPATSNTNQVRVTYAIGTTVGNNLLGQQPDYYTVEVDYWLWPLCGGVDCP